MNIDLFVRPVVADKENKEENPLDMISTDTQESVSYTHLDVYKRQV